MSDQKHLFLPIDALAPLLDQEWLHIAHPWHDDELGLDVATNGYAMLAWRGHQFAARPRGAGEATPPSAAVILRPSPGVEELGTTTLGDLLDWTNEPSAWCPSCGGHALPLRCGTCGDEIRRTEWPGLFFGRPVNRRLLARYLSPLWPAGGQSRDTSVSIRSTPRGGPDPIHLVAELWTVVIMPLRVEPSECDGPAFGQAPARDEEAA